MLEWEYSWLVWLIPLPILFYLLFPQKKIQQASLLMPMYAHIIELKNKDNLKSNRVFTRLFRALVLFLLWLLILASAAQPIWIGEPVTLPTEGRDLLLAVDISGSMAEKDMPSQSGNITRLEALKQVVGEFVIRRKSDRLGLILFADNAYMQTPLTFDRETVKKQLDEALIGFAGRATAIGDAIGLSIKRLLERQSETEQINTDRVIILLTDGSNTAGSPPVEAAKVAASENIKIYTIGIGAEVITRRGIFGFGSRQVRNTELDEGALKTIAQLTKGRYFRARNPKELDNIYQVIDHLEPQPEDLTYRPKMQLFHLPLTAALLLSVLACIFHLLTVWWWQRV